VDGQPLSARATGHVPVNNARALVRRAARPVLTDQDGEPLEARLWKDVFVAGRRASACRAARSKDTVRIEGPSCRLEMDEILFRAAPEHSAGLNCGRFGEYLSASSRSSAAEPRRLAARPRAGGHDAALPRR